ncbi:hypothetical protein MY04_05830 (plasmid) [Flammeovirga sp. MY04]|uniref:hypothetical protein n=1 Tax=Flammeovirga sp. MY04 TaxID=1191459 RepID=UPI0008061E72|nr:hypothetical protein [Flammeovirga sp. MY04]ANQ52898.1 hypothetical protein MY04_05830 [Flammeovirga sp. MY04]
MIKKQLLLLTILLSLFSCASQNKLEITTYCLDSVKTYNNGGSYRKIENYYFFKDGSFRKESQSYLHIAAHNRVEMIESQYSGRYLISNGKYLVTSFDGIESYYLSTDVECFKLEERNEVVLADTLWVDLEGFEEGSVSFVSFSKCE